MSSKRPAEGEPQGAGANKLPRENGYVDAQTPIPARVQPAPLKKRDPRFAPLIYRENDPLPGIHDIWRNAGGDEKKREVLVEVLIQPEFVSRENKKVKARQIWGDLTYTPDSDVVAVLMHLGYYAHHLTHPPNMVVEVRALIKLMPSLTNYPSKARFLKSRAWKRPSHTCAYEVERCWLITRQGMTVELSPCIDELPATQPTVQPQQGDRQMTTRNTGAKAKQSQEVAVQYNLCNEPWLKYTLAAVADKGLKRSQWTSARLVDGVMYLETLSQRYQVCRISPQASSEPGAQEQFTLALCKAPLPCGIMRKLGIPLPADQVEVLQSNLVWEDFKWGVNDVHVKDMEIQVKRINFFPVMKSEQVASKEQEEVGTS